MSSELGRDLRGGFLPPISANSPTEVQISAINDIISRLNNQVTAQKIIGDSFDIQSAIDSVANIGGGTVFLKNGTYLVDADIVVPSDVTLQGETGGGVIIDFQGTASQIIVSGSLVDNTGTCAVANKSNIVTGTGTTWTSALVGDYMSIKGRWFEIIAVNSPTQLVIDAPSDVDTFSGQAVLIASLVANVSLKDFSVQNSTDSNGAVFFAYSQSCTVDDVNIYTSTLGLNFLGAHLQNARNFFIGGCGVGLKITGGAVWTLYNFESYGNSGDGMVLDTLFNASVANASFSSSNGNNITVTGCGSLSLYDMENTSCGGKGIEITNSTDIEIFAQAVRRATSDGIKLTATCLRVSIHNVSFLNNGGFGVNIAAASDDKNTLSSNFFSGNTGGTLNNAGSNTINANPQT